MSDNRGSSWRKWDLHVHTPASLIANEYGGDTDEAWEKFISGLEAMSSDIKVIGINDYLFIDGYKKVLEYKESGRLPNIELILPVVEFRLKEFVGHEKLKRLNYHIIFADDSLIKADQIETQFLNGFRGKAKLSPDFADTVSWGGTISKDSLMDLGQKIYDSIPDEKKPANPNLIELGFDNINFELSSIEELLGEGSHPNTYLKDNYLKAIGKSEWEDFRWDGSINDKKSVINGAHIVFAASPDSETAIKSKEALTTQAVNNRLLHCSDAHTFCKNADKTITTSKEIGHCFTWVKADATFEGLKQILHETESRLYLGESKPVEPTNTIDNFTLSLPNDATITVEQSDGTTKTENFCFAAVEGTYEFSPYFNCLVGGRGTGKSTILNFLGQHSKEPNSSEKFWDKLNPSFDSSDTNMFSFDGVKQFEFIGQSEVESFAMNKQAFSDAIYKRADILSDGDLSYDEGTLTFSLNELSDYKKTLIELANLEDEKESEENDRDTLNNSVKITKSKEYSKIVDQITTHSNEKQQLETWREAIDELRESIENAQPDEDDDDFVDASQQDESTDDSTIAQPYEEAYEKAQASISEAVEILDENNFTELVKAEEDLAEKIEKDEVQLSRLLKKAGLSEENILQVKSAPQKLVRINETISKLQKRIDEKKDSLKGYDKDLKAVQLSKKSFEKKITDAISPLNKTLKEQAEANEQKDIKEIGLKYYFDIINVWKNIAVEVYSTFTNEYSDGERSDLVKEFIKNNAEVFSSDKAAIVNLINENIKKTQGQGYLKFLKEVFAKDHNFEIYKTIRDRHLNDVSKYRRIQVLYDSKDIEHASFGQKCTAVVVILMLFGNYPLIIDEPEAHLDSSLIANYLVPLIKKKKNNRQIIFATHNANFVVNGDAEKIFILKNDDGKTIFVETTIEDTTHRADLLKLEGGKEAFKKRSDKLKIL